MGGFGPTQAILAFVLFFSPFLPFSPAGAAELPSRTPGGDRKAAKVLRVGVVGPLTGASAPYGVSHLRGLRMARDDWNASGLLPLPIELHVADDGGDMGRVGALARDLLFRDEVSAFVGCINSGCTHVLEMICVKAHVPQITAVSTDPTITQAGTPWIFRCLADDGRQARALLARLEAVHPGRKVAIWIQGSRYGRRGGLEMARLLREAGRTVAVESTFPPGHPDGERLLDELGRSGAEVLVMWSLVADGIRLLKGLRRGGFAGPVLGPDGLALRALVEGAGEAAEGLVVTWPFDAGRDDPRTRDFVAAYAARYGEEPDSFAAHAYDALGLLAMASMRAGDDPYALRAELAAVRVRPGVTGMLGFDETGNDRRDVELAEVRGGRFVVLRAGRRAPEARRLPAGPGRR